MLIIIIMKQSRHQMPPKCPVGLIQLQYQVDSYLYPDLCIASDWYIILRLTSFKCNALKRGSQRPNSPYKRVLLDIFVDFNLRHWSPETVTLLTATAIFDSKLLTSTHRHFSSNIFWFYEVFNPKASCINTSSLNKPNSCMLITVGCCGREFQFLSVPTHSRIPSRTTLPTFYFPNQPPSLG